MVVEVEYLNGKYNGKGKFYNFDYQLIFEGEFLNGYKRKGKQYINGILEYEGEYLCGKKYNGKGYDENGNIIYEIKNGNGFVKEYDLSLLKPSLKYEGEYRNGMKNGKGKEYEKDKLRYEGEFLNGQRHGKGEEFSKDGQLEFEGEYKKGERWDGYGKEYDSFRNTLIYEGEYINGIKKSSK